MDADVIIIGGSYAGMAAALQLLRARRTVLVVDAGLPPDTMGWWSPMHRGVLALDALRVTRSLRQSAKRYRVTVDAAFDEVIARGGFGTPTFFVNGKASPGIDPAEIGKLIEAAKR